MTSFSALDRGNTISTIAGQRWDLLVIGGGITGAGILLDAASRGMRAVLIEKRDFAWGTSSRSTKLIHGGLRYLKQYEVGLVREVARERAIVYNNARHIVRPEPMLLPLYRGGSIGRFAGSVGLWLYDKLAEVPKNERRRMLSADETLKREPLLNPEGLSGGGLYFEYRTDDARLTLSVLKKAVSPGSHAVNYCKAIALIYDGGQICGATCRDRLTGNTFDIKAHAVINATGPWVDGVLKLDGEGPFTKKLFLTKGVHIVVPREKLSLRQSVYADVPGDDRMIFSIPRGDTVYIGTTDTAYAGSPDNPQVTVQDVDYLLDAVARIFPGARLKRGDVSATWCGLRPLIYKKGKSPSELSRRNEIFHTRSGLISIAGGKLTGYRRMAERVVDLVLDTHPQILTTRNNSGTRTLSLGGSAFASETELREVRNALAQRYGKAGIRRGTIFTLFARHGGETEEILKMAARFVRRGHDPEEACIEAEVHHCIHCEMTLCASDFIAQRTGMLYFERESLLRVLPKITACFQKYDLPAVDDSECLASPDELLRETAVPVISGNADLK